MVLIERKLKFNYERIKLMPFKMCFLIYFRCVMLENSESFILHKNEAGFIKLRYTDGKKSSKIISNVKWNLKQYFILVRK